MFEIDSLQERYLDDADDKRWLLRVLQDLADTQFPELKVSMEKNKANISSLLDQVLADADQYDFKDDNLLLVRYAIYAMNRNLTPMQNPELVAEVEKSETIKIGLEDQMKLADWVLRMYNLFNKNVTERI